MTEPRKRWTEREDMILIAYSDAFGSKWDMYQEYLPGRSMNSIRQRWTKLCESVWEEVDLFGQEEEQK
jgi:hypothetical protein